MKDQRSWVESCAAIISSYFTLAGPGELERLDEAPGLEEPPTPRAATELLSSLPPLCTLFLLTKCFTAVFSHQTSLLLEGETYCYQIPSPCGGSNSFPSPVKYAGFPTPLPRAMFSIPSQITLFLKH